MDKSPAILAQGGFDGFFRGLTHGMQGQRGEHSALELTLWGLLIFVSGLAAAGAYYWFVIRPRLTKAAAPAALFEKLCQAHRLDEQEAALLRDLVKHHRMGLAARIFLEPERFDPAVLPGSIRSQQSILVDLRNKLFEGL